ERLLAAHARGEDTTDRFAEFMDRHGQFFPDEPRDVDELIDSLARRAAAAERFLRSLSPEQRRELAQLISDALADAGLAAEMEALREHLRDLRPGLDWTSRERFSGSEPLGYGEATGAVAELADLDELDAQLAQEHAGATLDDVDVEAVERQLGAGAAADARALQQLERELRRQGWLQRTGDGLALTPKALRRLGQTALRHVFAQLHASGRGDHDDRSAGAAGEPTGSWRAWHFGDEQPLDAVRTVANAVLRTARHTGGDHGIPPPRLRLDVEDFAVVETEHRASAAVALCVDLSWSMYAEGRWGAMKQTALALQHLIATRFRQDSLQVIGFDRWARRLTAMELAAVEPAWVQGTNLAHALALARRHVVRHPQSEPVVLVVTDGEPTAHLDDDGEAFFAWPTVPETLRRTLVEVDALTRSGIAVNTFMLGDDPGLERFVDALARRNGGRVLAPSPDRLGEFVVADYLRARRRGTRTT
ncbi:MAG: vWA domain-containing protein, partial [Actinomycetota bacterium]